MLCAFIFMMAAVNVPMLKGTYNKRVNDTIAADSDFIETLLAPRIPAISSPDREGKEQNVSQIGG